MQVKYIIWSRDMSHAALISKHQLMIVDREMSVVCTHQVSEGGMEKGDYGMIRLGEYSCEEWSMG